LEPLEVEIWAVITAVSDHQQYLSARQRLKRKKGRKWSNPKCTVEAAGFHQQDQDIFNLGIATA
jgi:hypothetical protein